MPNEVDIVGHQNLDRGSRSDTVITRLRRARDKTCPAASGTPEGRNHPFVYGMLELLAAA
jgi:hypothetical protein